MGFAESDKSALEVSEEERHQVLPAHLGQERRLPFLFFETFKDIATSPEANETAAAFVREKIAEIVKDPATAKLLQPKGHYGGRPLCTRGYYEAFNEPNVALVDISTNRIARITPTGIALDSGQTFDFDIIVYGNRLRRR